MAQPTVFVPPYSARQPPPQYVAGWLLSELQRLQLGFAPRGVRFLALDGPATLPVLPSDYGIVVDTTNGEVKLTLPDPVVSATRVLVIKKVDLSINPVLLLGTVDGTVNYPITSQFQSATILAAGGLWNLIGIT